MKRNGFTLIELIFVIVIIGVLAAVAVPKFTNLKQSADASNVIKVANDAFSSIPPAYVNAIDLEDGNKSEIKLDEIVSLTGKNWGVDTSSQNSQTAKYTTTEGDVITITFRPEDRNVTLDIDCTKFVDDTTTDKCAALNGGSNTSSTTLDY
jgi:prepilin-type N-terminal cleavage/methylation domain-containing protein